MKKKLFITAVLINLFAFSLFAQSKNALLIANAGYKSFNPLQTPVSEARALKSTLESIGFNVTLIQDGSREDILAGLSNFEKTLKAKGGTGFFHYGGHAVQVNGKNYIIPVELSVYDEERLDYRAVNLDEVMTYMQADTNIVVLDACRDNPLKTTSRGAERGLKLAEVKPKNSIIIYSAEAGKTAQDGVFTPILTKHLSEQKELGEILKEVKKDVYNATKGTQTPGAYDSLMDNVYLAGIKSTTTVSTANTNNTNNNQNIYESLGMVKIPGKDFYMLKTEVTQELYTSIMGENPSNFKGNNNPVESVSWYDAIYFCNKLSVKYGLTPVYVVNGSTDVSRWSYVPHKGNSISGDVTQNTSANGFRLPTVDEWQYAAKGGQNYTYAGSNNLDEVGWFYSNSGNKTHSVAQKMVNVYGLYDMSGNVWEWCWDVDPNYSNKRYLCGGGYNCSADYCKVDDGFYCYAALQDYTIGFRIVRSQY